MDEQEAKVLSSATNYAVIQAPGRRFPGSLIQGDSLYSLCVSADDACAKLKAGDVDEAFHELTELRNNLWTRLGHYKATLAEHDVPLPFSQGL